MLLTGLLYEALELAKRALDVLTKPEGFTLFVTQVKGDDGMIEFKVTAPLPTLAQGKGTVTREVTLTVNGVAQPPVSLDITVPQYEQWVKEHDMVKASLVDIDQAGNRSQARETNEVEITDTIPPPQPGEFQLGVTDQREVPDNPTPPASPKKK